MENPPQILYKYRNLGESKHDQFLQDRNTKSFIYQQELYLAKASQFNDPFDVAIPFRFDPAKITVDEMEVFLCAKFLPYRNNEERARFRIQLSEILASPERFDEFFHNHDEVRKVIQEDFKIGCLAESPLNYLMWSHYSNSHKGICVGLDYEILCEELAKIVGSEYGYIFKVDYQDDLPMNGISLAKIFETGESLKALVTKGKIWEYESEYRIILGKEYQKSKMILPKECFKEFYFGWNSPPIKTRIISKLKQLYPNAKYYQIKPDGKQFKLDKDEITTEYGQ